MTLCLDVCIKQLIKKPRYNPKAHAVWRDTSVGEAPRLIRGHKDKTKHGSLTLFLLTVNYYRVKYLSSLLSHDYCSLFLHSDLQLPIINMSGPGPGDWGNCTDSGEE